MNVQLTKHEQQAMQAASMFTDSSDMYKRFPSLFATEAHPRMSAKYAFTNTYDILLHMHNKGFRVVSVMGGDHRFKKVMIRMRSIYYDTRDGSSPEVIVLDSHDGTTRLKMCMGVIRFACMNGVIAGDLFYSRAFTHRAPDLMQQVMLELEDIHIHTTKLIQRITAMRNRSTNIGERIALADAVVKARWGEDKDASFVADMRQRLLHVRRDEDTENDVYTVMNVIQENALRGGMSYITANNRIANVRPISDVRRNLNINQTLWNTAETMLAEAA
jgi:hypothetical protein